MNDPCVKGAVESEEEPCSPEKLIEDLTEYERPAILDMQGLFKDVTDEGLHVLFQLITLEMHDRGLDFDA